MGIFSDNFYSWLDIEHESEKCAMDSLNSGWKHPDGSACKASKPEN